MDENQSENYGGRIIRRDVDGKIVQAGLSPETASEMGKRRWAKPRLETKGTLLQQAGYENPDDAPEHLRVLADIASSGRSGAVAALRDFLRLTRRDEPDMAPAEPAVKLELSDEAVKYLQLIFWFDNPEDVEEIRARLAEYDAERERESAQSTGKP